jgi:hypothetical protein
MENISKLLPHESIKSLASIQDVIFNDAGIAEHKKIPC